MKSFDVDINELPPNKMRVLFSKNNLSQIICRWDSLAFEVLMEQPDVKVDVPFQDH